MAERVLNNNQLGKRSVPDFLALTFYAGNYENALDKNYSIEIQDLYVRLDQEIAQLLETVDKTVGMNNTLILLLPPDTSANKRYFLTISNCPEANFVPIARLLFSTCI